MRRSLQFVLSALLVFTIFGAAKASAAITITMQQTGPDVVFSYSGSLDISGLSITNNLDLFSDIFPATGEILFGGDVDFYRDVLPGPITFGGPISSIPSVTLGDPFGLIGGSGNLLVPMGYATGDPLSGRMIFPSSTFDSLSIDTASAPYVWTVDNPAANTITLQVVVPEPSSAMFLAGLGAAFSMRRRKRTRR